MNWNSMCAECHNTRVRKNYDAATDSYHTTMAGMGVGCEACHGPLQTTSGLAAGASEIHCARSHGRAIVARSHYRDVRLLPLAQHRPDGRL